MYRVLILMESVPCGFISDQSQCMRIRTIGDMTGLTFILHRTFYENVYIICKYWVESNKKVAANMFELPLQPSP